MRYLLGTVFLLMLFLGVPGFSEAKVCSSGKTADFCLQDPGDTKTRDVSDDPFVWEHFGIDSNLDYYKIQLRKLNGSWVNENVPTSFCSGSICEITPLSFSVVTLEFLDRYDWKVIAYNKSDIPIGTSQQWYFLTESAPKVTPPPGSGGGGIPAVLENPISSQTLPELLNNVLNFLFSISIVILPIIILYGGFLMLTAAGDPAKISQSRTILLWAVIAFAIILLARGLPEVIRTLL